MSNDRIFREEQIWNMILKESLKAIRVQLIDQDGAFEPLVVTTPKLSVIPCAISNQKYQHTFQDGTKKFILCTGRKISVVKYNWNETDFDNGIFHEIEEGGEIKRAGLDLTGKTIFFSCDNNNCVIEVEEWT